MIDRYTITLDFINSIHGGIPAVDASDTEEERTARYAPWIAKQAQGVPVEFQDEETDAVAIAEALAVDESMPEMDGEYDVPLTGFRRVEGRPVIETRQVKAMLREA